MDSDKILKIPLFRGALTGYFRMHHHCKNSLAIKRQKAKIHLSISPFIFPGANSRIYCKTSSGKFIIWHAIIFFVITNSLFLKLDKITHWKVFCKNDVWKIRLKSLKNSFEENHLLEKP